MLMVVPINTFILSLVFSVLEQEWNNTAMEKQFIVIFDFRRAENSNHFVLTDKELQFD